MVVGAKISMQHVPSKGRISIMRIQNFTVRKRQSVIKILYGTLLVVVGVVMLAINPLQLVTNWIFEIKEGSFLYNMWEQPPYKLYAEVWVYNYTNVEEYLSGEDTVMKVKEVGPFLYQEFRTNQNITIDKERGVMSLTPHIALKFQKNLSLADTNDVHIYAPNIALLAISTLLADKLGYLANAGAYYSINALGSKLFRNLTVEELLWGYEDPIVTVANSLLPGWIDFQKIGILDRFYANKDEVAEVEIGDVSNKFSIINWNESPGIVEQGFTDLNTSIPCNRVQGTYEGLMLSPNYPKDRVINIFRRQACRIYPFAFYKEVNDKYGFNYYRFRMEQSAFNTSSPYACKCKENCLPDGFVDVSNCYYGFPIALSKPHFLDTDPQQKSYYEGMNPDPEIHSSVLDMEPTLGVPLALSSKMQVNLAVRTSSGNPITRPFKNKVVPMLWLSLYCKEPPPPVLTLLQLRLVIAPPLIITIEVLLFLVGAYLGIHGFYRTCRPQYTFIEDGDKKKSVGNVAVSNVAENATFEDDVLAKEAVSLLSIREEEDLPNLIIDT
ncbi:scavenger receptor class B member 1-like [Ostrinia furnacalis]|uniref:scavenger receptor class B member 1-like n=1 Tax=Ostrinia furnacalis TaxID=93504 RepID=UPI00103A1DF2|nr:scavenger receptor class B member 1-like [Ostrinia furnacalis]